MTVGDTLGTNTNLRDTFGELDRCAKRLKASSDKGLRDKYTLDEVSILVQKWYENDKDKFTDLVKDPDKMPSFKRNTICGSIVTLHSAIKHSCKHEDSYFQSNITQCSSVWVCPICGAKIQARRAREVEEAVIWAEEEGYQVVMATFTASHKANYRLVDFADLLGLAYRKTLDQSKRERKKYEIGNIRALEFTWSGRNGWHPHFHTLFILAADCDVDEFFAKMGVNWKYQCIKYGLLNAEDEKAVKSFDAHSFHIKKNGSKGFDLHYLTKSANEWGAAKELAKSTNKEGRVTGHFSPFQMLFEIATAENMGLRLRLMHAFVEYMLFTKQRNQLLWSRGLKALVGIEEKDDKALIDEETDKAYTLGGLTVAHWQALRSRHARIRYFTMLRETHGSIRAVDAFFTDLDPTLPPLLSPSDVRLLEDPAAFEDPDREDELIDLIDYLYSVMPDDLTYTAFSPYNPFYKAIIDFVASLKARAV